MTPDFFDEKSKTGLGFEFRQPQRKCQRRHTLQSMANPVVSKTNDKKTHAILPIMIDISGSAAKHIEDRVN